MARLAIRMPKMSMTMTEGDLSGWLVEVGDEISAGDAVAEVMTDKVDMEVESSVAGTLVEIVVESGMVPVGEPIGWVEGDDEGGGFGDLLSEPGPEPAAAAPTGPVADTSGEQAADATGQQAAEAPASSPRTEGPVAAVPRARGLARERGIDLVAISGTGPDGLVRVADVEAASPTRSDGARPAASRPHASRPGAGAPGDARQRKVRQAVARVMSASAAVPQFTLWQEIVLDTANGRRQGLSWTTVMLRAYAAALRDVPELLSRWEDGGPVATDAPVVALAVATDRGLMVPTFVEPDRAEPGALDAEIRQVVADARAGRLGPAYLQLPNASLSNLAGVDRFQALVTPPQASVLALGAIRPRPVAVPGGVGSAMTVHAGLTVDHRVADGAHGAELLARFEAHLDTRLGS